MQIHNVAIRLLVTLSVAVVFSLATANAQKLPTSTTIGTNPAGTVFYAVSAVEMNLGYQGPAKLKIGGKNPLPHVPNARLIMRGSPLSVSLVVKKDSPMKTVHDVKGKRVTGEYPANAAIWP